jgi:glutaredoxin
LVILRRLFSLGNIIILLSILSTPIEGLNYMLTVYSKEGCNFCMKAKAHLDKLGVEYLEKLLNRDFDRDAFLFIYPDARTFPQIVEEDGTVIGGYSQLIANEKYQTNPVVTE